MVTKVREIGSEFWDVPIINEKNELFPQSTHWFLSGRSALQAIIKELVNCESVALPSWCCKSMIVPFVEAGLKTHFYPVYWQGDLIQEIDLNSDVLLLMDYFGHTSDTPAPKLNGYKGIVIRDVTHSLFSKEYDDADYYFGSLRKWCGVWTGGYAWTKDGGELVTGSADGFDYISLRQEAMRSKKKYIEGECDSGKQYLTLFSAAEDTLEKIRIAPSAERDIELAAYLDVDKIVTQRRANAEFLRNAFPEWIMFRELKDKDCPMFVPVIVPDGKRDLLRQHLINNEIYCPVHWPISSFHILDKQREYIYESELSLVCDQRYAETDMMRMVDVIYQFIKEK